MVFAHGQLRLYLLALLESGPKHGYELITALADRFGGTYRPSPGTVYPRLARLEEDGLVERTDEGRRATYTLTDAGRAELDAQTRRPPRARGRTSPSPCAPWRPRCVRTCAGRWPACAPTSRRRRSRRAPRRGPGRRSRPRPARSTARAAGSRPRPIDRAVPRRPARRPAPCRGRGRGCDEPHRSRPCAPCSTSARTARAPHDLTRRPRRSEHVVRQAEPAVPAGVQHEPRHQAVAGLTGRAHRRPPRGRRATGRAWTSGP